MNLYDGIPCEAQITYDHPLECAIKYLFGEFNDYTNKKFKLDLNFNERKIDTGIRKIHNLENTNSTYLCYFQTCIVFSSSDLMDILQKFIAINLIFSKTLIDISLKPLFQFILVMAGFEKYATKCRDKLLEYMEDLKEFCEKIIEEKLA
uniref:Uncharacterized protein n=1 Tax=Strongyloides papillosus TaxID=174720 RepID=A0A0N5B423_STREA